jgi:hypothetical protein
MQWYQYHQTQGVRGPQSRESRKMSVLYECETQAASKFPTCTEVDFRCKDDWTHAIAAMPGWFVC